MPSPLILDIKPSQMAQPVVPAGMQPLLPLQGLTVLVVEDSRYACEAVRLMCQRAGARLRRAETLQLARAHLRVYRPDVVIIDLGLPDGRGESLIADLAQSPTRPTVVLGTSGNPLGQRQAMAAGADGFLDKPYASLASFCTTLLAHFPNMAFTGGAVPSTPLLPDPLALRDDLVQAARALSGNPDRAARRYLTGFLSGIADHAKDSAMASAAADADAVEHQTAERGFRLLRDLVADRLTESPAFSPRNN